MLLPKFLKLTYTRHMANLFTGEKLPDAIVGYAQVAVEQSVDVSENGLTYAIPAALSDVQPGDRVIVPLGRGNRAATGYVMQVETQNPAGKQKLKSIRSVDPHAIRLPEDILSLARWIARYYISPLGMVLASMVPAAVKKGIGRKQHTRVRLAQRSVEDAKPTKSQQAVLDAAKAIHDTGEAWCSMDRLLTQSGVKTRGPLNKLIEAGLLETRQEYVVTGSLNNLDTAQAEPIPQTLTHAQQAAMDQLLPTLGNGFGVRLLHGVTGSGKTEVYLRLIEALRNRASDETDMPGVIVLVPEIALTPQTVQRFVSRFTDVAVLHSGLSDTKRHAQWQRIFEGKANVVVGTRSAVFAPLRNLQLIIVDEEHDTSYKQDQVPRYHARDVAIKRAHLNGFPIVLGSATPSLESYINATGKGEATAHYEYIALPERVADMKLPTVELVDMTQERQKRYQMTGKAGWRLLSLRLEHALRETFKAGKQSILLLNRRGYANYVACPDANCGWLMNCHHCDVTMVYHKQATNPKGGYLQCHHCTATQMLPTSCPVCSKKVVTFGLGTQRVEEELARLLPEARLARMDSDAMRKAADYEMTLGKFRTGELDILLGTQMVAKGLDFPNVHLVGMISADMPTHLADFRASERAFQLICQVVGRAGRSADPGRAIVQTYNINDPAVQLAAKHDYATFAARELKIREETMYPPIGRMARIVHRDRDEEKCKQVIHEQAEQLGALNRSLGLNVRIVGPMPCTIARLADYYRWQIELQAGSPHAAGRLQKLLAEARQQYRLVSGRLTAIDVDPVSGM